MALELRAELRLRDGQKRTVRVQTGAQTGAQTGVLALASLISAVRELGDSVTCLLTELVQREQAQGACATELDGADEEDEDEDDEDDPSDSEPEPKRTKP